MVDTKKKKHIDAPRNIKNNKLFLHIGLHKTGSTSIQSALHSFKKNDIKTLDLNISNHSIPLYTIFSSKRYDYHIWKAKGFKKDDIDKIKLKYLDRLENQLSNLNNESLIISGEDLSILKASEVESMYKFFLKFNIDVKVICYVRDPVKFIVSGIQERVKNGLDIGIINSLYKNKILPYIKYFGKKNVSVFCFENILNSHGSVVKHFSETLSISLNEPPRKNISLTEVQFALITELNEVPLKIFGHAIRHQIRKEIVQAIIKITNSLNLKQKIDDRHLMCFASNKINEETLWLEQEFGITFANQHFLNSQSISLFYKYINEIIENIPFDVLKKIFNEIKVDYDESIDLKSNFTEAYFTLISR
jgi:hypothetical protein